MAVTDSVNNRELEEVYDTYGLLIEREEQETVQVGALTESTVPAGYYFYTGSAKRGLIAHLERHHARRSRKSVHWHIDYFLPDGGIRSVFLSTDPECELNRRVFDVKRAEVPLENFGSSDCSCGSHLAYLQNRPELPLDDLLVLQPDRFRSNDKSGN